MRCFPLVIFEGFGVLMNDLLSLMHVVLINKKTAVIYIKLSIFNETPRCSQAVCGVFILLLTRLLRHKPLTNISYTMGYTGEERLPLTNTSHPFSSNNTFYFYFLRRGGVEMGEGGKCLFVCSMFSWKGAYREEGCERVD